MNKTTDVINQELIEPRESIKGEYLHALMLKLRSQRSGDILPHAGQLAHAALLHWFAEVDTTFATYLHEPNARRPFTCSSLWFPNTHEVIAAQRTNRRLFLFPNQIYWLRFTMLTDKLFRTFMKRFFQATSPTVGKAHGELDLPTLRLGSAHFDVVEVIMTSPEPGQQQPNMVNWSGYATYSGLVEQTLTYDLSKATTWNVGLEFRSPTAFSNGQTVWGKQMHVFPDPERVFDSLARAWNTWAPSHFILDTRTIQAYVRDWVVISHYELQTHTFHFDRSTQEGFTGRCVYAMKEREWTRSRYAQTLEEASTSSKGLRRGESLLPATVGAGLTPVQALHLLANFAFYAGVGYKTTMGMGQTRPLNRLTDFDKGG